MPPTTYYPNSCAIVAGGVRFLLPINDVKTVLATILDVDVSKIQLQVQQE